MSEQARAGQDLPPGAASCLECHADAGHAGGAMPPLKDLSVPEIAAALAAFRTGQRDGTIMPRIAPGFTEVESRAIAEALGRPEREP